MNRLTWQKLDAMFAEFPIMKASPVLEAELEEAARAFGFPLPEDYAQFVCKYGGATVGPYDIYGLRASETMGARDGSVFEVTKRLRADGWEGLNDALIFSSDHAGNPVYLKPNGEVWISDHDFDGHAKLAENFEDYLVRRCLS